MVIGAHTDLDALRRAAAGADALTFDHEHVPTELLEKLVAEGVNVAPPPQALIHAQDKLVMRRRLEALGAPVPRFAAVTERRRRRRVRRARRRADRGQDRARRLRRPRRDAGPRRWPRPATSRPAIWPTASAVLVEERVAMRRELAALVARSPFGQGAAWPVVQTVQRDGICVEVIAPAPGLAAELGSAAGQLALRLADELGVVGVLAVELFETVDGALLVNELAMRPHNSGHWTMDGARTSQFEQHLRAVLDYPLGDTAPIAPVTVMANVLGAQRDPAMTHGRAAAPSVRPDARGQGAPVRQGRAARPQDRPRQRPRRRRRVAGRRRVRRGCAGTRGAGRTLVVARANGPTDGTDGDDER